MKSLPRLISRFVCTLLISVILLLIVNIVVIYSVTRTMTPSGSPYTTAKGAAASLEKTSGGYALPSDTAEEFYRDGVWAMLIDDNTHQVIWQTENLPDSVPREYSLADISDLTLGYINDCTTYAGRSEYGLLVIGYPHGRYWKSMYPTWDYVFIANVPRIALTFLAVNVALIFLIYAVSSSRLMRSVRPISEGIQALPTGKAVYIKEQGPLYDLAVSINKTSEMLQEQGRRLRKRDRARANWIAGISHDIRTPLSMVMGYAGQLESAESLSEDEQRKAGIIVKQSGRIRDLINDLNLASKLEYDMQPVKLSNENLIAIARQVAVDFINLDVDGKNRIEWDTTEDLTMCPVQVNRDLIKRAIGNLIQNSINHNEQGSTIHILVTREEKCCHITVSDDGSGATDEEIDILQSAPYFMAGCQSSGQQRHGLGLLIVRQIAAAHGGDMEIRRSKYGGFEVDITLPLG